MNMQDKALGHAILSAKVVQDAYSAAKDMNREKLIEVVRWIALSHERLRMELEGAEKLIDETKAEADLLRRRWREEEDIVDRVWKALGCACYQDCGGKTIWELVAELKQQSGMDHHKQAEEQ